MSSMSLGIVLPYDLSVVDSGKNASYLKLRLHFCEVSLLFSNTALCCVYVTMLRCRKLRSFYISTFNKETSSSYGKTFTAGATSQLFC